MVEITLPDGAKRQYDGATSGMDIALSISPGLAKKALAVTVNGQAWDLTREITTDSDVAIIVRDKGAAEALDIIRHDCAHVLAEAVAGSVVSPDGVASGTRHSRTPDSTKPSGRAVRNKLAVGAGAVAQYS